MSETPLDEQYDTMMEVQRNPCGAWMAIQSQAAEIRRLRAAIEDVTHGRGAFGVSLVDDFVWAVSHLQAALEQNGTATVRQISRAKDAMGKRG